MKEKSILMSIRPQYVAKILNGEKTIEVRKKFPKDYVGWVYIYCTKDNKEGLHIAKDKWVCIKHNKVLKECCYNGTVVARFWCDKVEHFEFETCSRDISGYWYDNGQMVDKKLLKQSCLTYDEFYDYIKCGEGYAIHISKLEVFDKPKELKSFVYYSKGGGSWCSWLNCIYLDHTKEECENCKEIHLQKAPQSWCYVEDTL